MSENKTPTSESALKVLNVLRLLLKHFAHGLAPSEIAKHSGLSPSLVTRYVATLIEAGFAERVPETNRIRPSVRLAQDAVAILKDVERATHRFNELHTRINTP